MGFHHNLLIIVITASIFFPWAPLFAYLGIAGTSGTALAISVLVEAAIAIVQTIFIDPFFLSRILSWGSEKWGRNYFGRIKTYSRPHT